MSASRQEDLFESESSCCLGLLMSFKEPNSPLEILKRASKMRDAILFEAEFTSECIKPLEEEEDTQASYTNEPAI